MTLFSLLLQQPSSNPILSFLPLLVIVAIFYLLVFMPMQKQKKQQAQMLKELEAGNDLGVRFVIPEQGARWHFK